MLLRLPEKAGAPAEEEEVAACEGEGGGKNERRRLCVLMHRFRLHSGLPPAPRRSVAKY